MDNRYKSLLTQHAYLFNEEAEKIFSTSGRTELGGNHTDHNLGKVIAGSINLDTIAAVKKTDTSIVKLISEGFPEVVVDISDIEIKKEEEGSTHALVRGIAASFKTRGIDVRGFNANTTTNVLKGSGLSSSAAIEVLCATIFNNLYNNDKFDPVTLAIIGQESENIYFGKPCGLMDQIACGYGGIVQIDFENPKKPLVNPVSINFSDFGYSLVIVNTGGNHADLTPEYGAIPFEMKSIAKLFNKKVLREIDENEFYSNLKRIRQVMNNDRAILRAIHFFEENRRVDNMLTSLKARDFNNYLKLVQESGNSSAKFLQNVFCTIDTKEQGISLALAVTEKFLQGKGASRVQGGGFAGTIQSYIPLDMVDSYCTLMDSIFGENSSVILSIRPNKTGCVWEK